MKQEVASNHTFTKPLEYNSNMGAASYKNAFFHCALSYCQDGGHKRGGRGRLFLCPLFFIKEYQTTIQYIK